MNDMSLILEFVQEAREYIDEVEPTLIEIQHGSDEAGAVDQELINSVFRLFHSMKGSAGFLALNTVTSVTHEAETLLDKIRNGKLSLTVQVTTTLCKALDLFREMLEHIADTGNDDGFTEPADVIIGKLKKHAAGEPLDDDEPLRQTIESESPPLAPPQPEPPTAEPRVSADAQLDTFIDECHKHQETHPIESTTALQLSPEMQHGFVLEATEQLDAAEQSLLLVLDENVDSMEPLKDAFRYIHSFKGNCGFMGLVDLEHLSHTMETLLDKLRNGEMVPTNQNISKLLGLLDVLGAAVDDLEAGGAARIPDIEVHVQSLNAILNGGEEPMAEVPEIVEPTPVSAPTAPQIESPKTQLDVSDVLPEINGDAPKPVAKPGAVPPAVPASGTAASGTATKAKQDIRVDLHKLDLLINLVGELVIAESMVTRCPAVAHVEDEYYNRAKHQLRRICDDLKDTAMSVRMIPLSATFRKMIRLVHDLATKSGKKIKLNLVGEETEVDKTVIEQIADPLVHIVRNSCDHGIEASPEDRIKAGKNEIGTVTLEGKHEGGEVWIMIRDDGRGLDRERIINKAMEKGLVGVEAKDWPDEKVFKLVFEPGFSTADKVTDISGRGVGMDVVKRNIEKLNGRIDIVSRAGQGSTFTLRIPLTLAIVDAMLVRVGKGRYMIPTLTIRESLVPMRQQVTITPEGREILRLREEMVPVIRLYDVFVQEPGSEKLKDGILIVAEDAGRSFAFFVDEIVGQQQTVIKGLPDYVGKSNGFSGCTILGDGTVSLIVDVGAVSQMSGSFAASPVNKAQYWSDEEKTAVDTAPHDVSFADLEAVVG